jgi:hypothetical protein
MTRPAAEFPWVGTRTLRRETIACALGVFVIVAAIRVAFVETIQMARVFLYRAVHPGAALVIGPILVCFRLRTLKGSNATRGAVLEGGVVSY